MTGAMPRRAPRNVSLSPPAGRGPGVRGGCKLDGRSRCPVYWAPAFAGVTPSASVSLATNVIPAKAWIQVKSKRVCRELQENLRGQGHLLRPELY